MALRRWNCLFRVGAKWRELVAGRLSVEAGSCEHRTATYVSMEAGPPPIVDSTFTVREYSLQDANTLEATHSMLNARVKTAFPLCDQEILLRNLYRNVGLWVEELGAERTAK